MLKTSKTIVTFALVLTLGAWTLNNLNGNSLAVAAEPLLLKGHSDAVINVRFSPDSKKALTQSAETIRIWDAGTGKELLEIKIGNQHHVHPHCFSPDGKKVAGYVYPMHLGVDTVRTRTARIWDAETGKELLEIRATPIYLSPDGKKALGVTGEGRERTVARIWDVE